MDIKHTGRPEKPVFLTEDEIREQLGTMEKDGSIKTGLQLFKTSPTAAHLVTFQDFHAQYLKDHPKLNPAFYLANLRTSLRIRP